MTRSLVINFFSKLDENIKKWPTTKQNLDKRKAKKHKTYFPLAFLPLLFVVLVLLSSLSSSFAPKSGYFHVSHCVKKI